MWAIVVLVNSNGDLQDFYIPLLGRPTAIVFTDRETASEFATAVTFAWSGAGYTGASLQIDGVNGFQEAVDAVKQRWPAYRQNAFLEDTDPAVVELMQWLRQGGRLGGPAG